MVTTGRRECEHVPRSRLQSGWEGTRIENVLGTELNHFLVDVRECISMLK